MRKRMTNRERRRVRFVKHIRETWMNKIWAAVLILCGIAVTKMSGDGTVLVILSMFAVPMLFVNKQVIF